VVQWEGRINATTIATSEIPRATVVKIASRDLPNLMDVENLVRRINHSRGACAAMIGLVMIAAECSPTPAPLPPAPPKLASGATHAAPSFDVAAEAARVHMALRQEVPNLITDTPESEQGWIVRTRAAIAVSDLKITRPQLVVVVDRNPDVQQLRLILAQIDALWQSLGGTKVSTGQSGRRDYYLTPTGVFLHTDAILDWRAEGTYNDQHIRGLGVKGMRVWDFGWQRATKGWGSGETGDIRLLLHATDPTYLEQRIGHPASKGCVRIPAAMNRFLDRHGILDADYERAAASDLRFAALLLPDRIPTPLAGDTLVIVDSSEPTPVTPAKASGFQARVRPPTADRFIDAPRTAEIGGTPGCS
jgi:lipoprotein-anchoring transpeptidase ErfK/SrfK